MNKKSIHMVTIAFLAASAFLMIGGIGIQVADAGSGPGCNHKGGASTTVDSNAPNTVNADTPPAAQPVV